MEQELRPRLKEITPAPASSINPAVPQALDEVITRGLARNPVNRYASPLELAEQARAALASEPVASLPGQGPNRDLTTTTVVVPPRRRRWPAWVAAAVVVLAVLAVGGVLLLNRSGSSSAGGGPSDSGARSALVRDSGSSSTPPTGGSPTSEGTAPVSAQTDPAASAPAVALAVGNCLDASSAQVQCGSTHEYEIVSTGGTCTYPDLLTYLGGETGTDTLLAAVHLQRISVGGSAYCAAVGPNGDQQTGIARNILRTSSGDAWRRCFDARYSAFVGCNRPHTTEYVYSRSDSTGPGVKCVDAAGQYLGIAYANVESDLAVDGSSQGTAQACWVTARGGQLLTASVRGIGTNALPLEPA